MNNITPRLHHVLPTEADVAAYREHGFWLSGIVLPPEILGAAERGMKRFYAGERDRPGPPGLEGDGWRPENGDVLRKNDYASLRVDELSALVAYPAIGAIAARLSGATGIRLWHDQLLFKPAGAPDRSANVGWHTDRQYWQTCSSEDMLTAWVPFHDVDERSGSITFIDSSHLWDTAGLDFFASDLERQETALTAAGHTVVKSPAVLKRGQVSFHHNRTIHGSGPNQSTAPRRSLAIHLQPSSNRYRHHTLPDGTAAHHRNDDLCRRGSDAAPDYTDPALFPVLWPIDTARDR
ncbi:MAG: phytanoyl-CoA dioxygenase family protein [Streptosporangiaceae bacterium]